MTWRSSLPLQFSTTVAAFVVDEAAVTSLLTWQVGIRSCRCRGGVAQRSEVQQWPASGAGEGSGAGYACLSNAPGVPCQLSSALHF